MCLGIRAPLAFGAVVVTSFAISWCSSPGGSWRAQEEVDESFDVKLYWAVDVDCLYGDAGLSNVRY